MTEDVVVIGAGIIGLATAHELSSRGRRVVVVDKEDALAAHQTGRNSGVIHSGLYYQPGSLKASLGTAGAASMVAFARQHGVPVDVPGKLVVATRQSQLGALHELLRRGEENGVPCRLLSPQEAAEFEPHVSCVGALRVESTGIVDYRGVCEALAEGIRAQSGRIELGQQVTGIAARSGGVRVTTTGSEIDAAFLVNCAGLHSDRIARLAGLSPDLRIVPFRGEYFELSPEGAALVKGLIYPVPDPSLPFLGVHLTKMIGGGVHAGPNAVLALAREGYRWRDVSVRDLAETLRWPGVWRLGRRYPRTAYTEVRRSLSRRRFLTSLRELVPDLSGEHLVPAPAGVRAQALRRDGTLVDDFYYLHADRQIHVLNAPSPAATAALEIARRIADESLRSLGGASA